MTNVRTRRATWRQTVHSVVVIAKFKGTHFLIVFKNYFLYTNSTYVHRLYYSCDEMLLILIDIILSMEELC